MAYLSFEDLDVWKRTSRLAVELFGLVDQIKRLSLKDQIQRAAVSVPSNIAEGHERGGMDFKRFLRIALGSAAELRTQLYIALKLGIIAQDTTHPLINELKQLSAMLHSLSLSIPAKQNSNTPSTRGPETGR